jgi:transcriptional regulator of arginine metabolism
MVTMTVISKGSRQQRIRDILSRQQVFNQEQLAALLAEEDISVTQATLSRDLHDLGVSKGPAGYQLPEMVAIAPVPVATRDLERMLPVQLISAEAGANLVVLRTQPGHANPLALEIDRARLDEVMGTVAGDDTVFVATKNAAQARRLLKRFRALAGWM